MFPDDTAIWETGRDIIKLNAKIRDNMDSIQAWSGKWGFKVSLAKMSVVLFHQSKNKKIKVWFNGSVVKREEKTNFLDLIFDRMLSWKSHIEYRVDKFRKRINILKALAGSKWGADKMTIGV